MRTARPLLSLMVLLTAPGCFRLEETKRASATREPPDARAPASVARTGSGSPPAPVPLPEAAPPRPDAGAPASSCRVDDDCAVTQLEPGACCQSCATRAVTRLELRAIDAHVADCKDRGFKCAYPVCAPPRHILRPACEGGACVLHAESGD